MKYREEQAMLRRISILAVFGALFFTSTTNVMADSCVMPRARPAPGSWSVTLSPDGKSTSIITAASQFPEGDSFGPEPTNLLPTVYANLCDVGGVEIPNTLPSSPEQPYNLHSEPAVTTIDKTSPTDDLAIILKELRKAVGDPSSDDPHEHSGRSSVDLSRVRFAIDILEGNTVPRVYSGFPILHYIGPLKTKSVTPIYDNNRNVVGGTLTINQIWYDSHIESDTSYVDSSIVADVPWTIHYRVHVLNRGADDFAPMMMTFDDSKKNDGKLLFHASLDQTFFPMLDGQLVEFEMKMPPSRFWNLTYHWGWRKHPPRVQVVENMNVKLGGMPRNSFESAVFGENPRASEDAKLAAINMIGDLAPEKRMWNAFRKIAEGVSGETLRALVTEAEESFDDWQNRNRLPRGVKADPKADMTLFFANNTIYGHIDGFNRDMQMEMYKWKKRGDKVKVELLNADYFPKGYVLVDFGGQRGWENTFHNTLPIGGAGPWFTFGRNHSWMNTASGPVMVPVATRLSKSTGKKFDMDDMKFIEHEPHTPDFSQIRKPFPAKFNTTEGLGKHDVEITFNYDPPPRLRMYQFDAFHHDTAIWSPH